MAGPRRLADRRQGTDDEDVVERIRGGNVKGMGALVGPMMRETKGRADGGEVNRLIREQLGV